MKTENKNVENNFDSQFNSQKQLRQHVIDKFAKFGHKVKYQFKLSINHG